MWVELCLELNLPACCQPHRVLPGKMAGQVLQAQLASEGSLEAWAFQAPKVAV